MPRPAWPLHPLPVAPAARLLAGALLAALAAVALDAWWEPAGERALHDLVVASQPRKRWPHTVVVFPDTSIPSSVTRPQLLPLLARAAEQAVEAGAAAVFLEGPFLSFPDGRMPYPRCVEALDGEPAAQWDEPTCLPVEEEGCTLKQARWAPMLLEPEPAARIVLTPPVVNISATGGVGSGCSPEARYPMELLLGKAASRVVTLSCTDPARPLAGADGVERFVPLVPRHAAALLAGRAAPERLVELSTARGGDERCALPAAGLLDVPCKRVLSAPAGAAKRQLLPLGILAGCDVPAARAAASNLRGKVVILSSSPSWERADLHVVPGTVSPPDHALLPGPLLLADQVETLLCGDEPRRPEPWARFLLVLLAALAGAAAGARLRPSVAGAVPPLVACLSLGLGFLTPDAIQLFPVAAPALAAILALCFAVLLREGRRLRAAAG